MRDDIVTPREQSFRVGSRVAISYVPRTMRAALITLATLALQLGVPPLTPTEAFAGDALADGADEQAPIVAGSEIRVGDLLQATRDVSLDEAVIAEGSKVSVSGKRAASGAVVLDVALADGHVVRGVPLTEIRKNFKRVQ